MTNYRLLPLNIPQTARVAICAAAYFASNIFITWLQFRRDPGSIHVTAPSVAASFALSVCLFLLLNLPSSDNDDAHNAYRTRSYLVGAAIAGMVAIAIGFAFDLYTAR